MKPTLLTIRAIGAEFANQLWLPVVLLASGIGILLIALVWWLSVAVSSWWLLLGFPVVIALSVAAALLTVFKFVIRFISPVTTKQQRLATKGFVDKLSQIAEVAGTPKFILLFQIVRDIAAPKENGLIGDLVTNTSSLKGDFQKLRTLF